MRKYPMPIYVVLFLVGATALWYFGHHRPAQKILEAEPRKVYKSTPLSRVFGREVSHCFSCGRKAR